MPQKIKKPKSILGVNTNLIESYIKFFENSKLNSLVIEEPKYKIILKREKKEKEPSFKIQPVEGVTEKALRVEHTEIPSKSDLTADKPSIEELKKYHKIVSPLIGTFYRAPAPNSPPFVKEGDTVTQGQTLCIIEAMKVMNMIKSDVNGKIIKILVENGKPVKQGDALFLIETL